MNPPAYRLPGVNLFASGLYRGKKWPPEVVQSIADNIRRNGPSGTKLLIPPAVLGHEEDQDWLNKTDLPAAGWVDPDTATTVPDPDHPGELILRGDVVNVPPEVADRIKKGEFANGSGEFYELSNDFGASQGFTMRRFGLLGGEVPQVKRLGRLPMPVPMDALKVFAETPESLATKAAPKGGAAIILAFSERQTMDRTAAYAAIKAVMPGLSQACLDLMSDDQVNELVANLPAAMSDTTTTTPTRDEMIAALVGKGGDQTSLSAMADAALSDAYKKSCMSDTATDPNDPNKKKLDPNGVSMSEAEKQAVAALNRITILESSAAAREKAAIAREQQAKRKEVEIFCDRQIAAGRLLPRQKDDYIALLVGLDDTAATHTFSENGKSEKVTPFEAKKREMDRWPQAVKFGEKIPGGTTDTGTPEAKKAAAIQKARDHAATVGESAWKSGSFGSAEGFVAYFSEVFDKNPETALKMLG